jgi:hypothetical protein
MDVALPNNTTDHALYFINYTIAISNLIVNIIFLTCT